MVPKKSFKTTVAALRINNAWRCKNQAMRCFLLLVFLVFLCCAKYSHAQLRHLDIDNGLSNNNVNVIYKDRLGFLWFGTVDGLNRFDGYNFKIFRSVNNEPAALSGNDITAISQDINGHLWIATQSNGVSILDERNGRFQRLKKQASENAHGSYLDGQVNALTYCYDHTMLIGTNSEGLMLYDSNGKLSSIPLTGQRGITATNYSVQCILQEDRKSVV